MSYLDLATLTSHRRNEMEARISSFAEKCDHTANYLTRLKKQAKGLVERLNCDPSDLKEKFLSCMQQLDEYNYVITDFNLALGNLLEGDNAESSPVHDRPLTMLIPTPANPNLLDALSETVPTTNSPCFNLCPPEKIHKKKIRKSEQTLITFSNSSSSSEITPKSKKVAPETKSAPKKHQEVQCELDGELKELTINAEKKTSSGASETANLPAQTVLSMDQKYTGSIVNVDGTSFWVITDDPQDVVTLISTMTNYYNDNKSPVTMEDFDGLTYCAYYDLESDWYYRALFVRVMEEESNTAEVFLVDTGEFRCGNISNLHHLAPQFCEKPPYARCCHLAGVDLLNCNKESMEAMETLMKQYQGITCVFEVDDNSSESLGVNVVLENKQNLNRIINQELGPLTKAVTPGRFNTKPATAQQNGTKSGPPELDEFDIDITDCPEYDDPVEAVTGYHNRDEADICKHYKGGSDKTCFKGTRCKKKHILKHPDGWTLDKVEALKIPPCPLPAPGTWHNVRVSNVAHYNKIYIQFVDEKPADDYGVSLVPVTLEDLVKEMNTFEARRCYKELRVLPAIGEIVAALYPYDNLWYRAQVLGRIQNNVHVMYVDYGNTVSLPASQLRVLPARLAARVARAARACLPVRAPGPEAWAAAAAELRRRALDRTLRAHILERNYDEVTISLLDEDGYNIAEQLAASNFVQLIDTEVTDDCAGGTCHIVP